ncbi:MAG: ABC transporter permease [Candidatus Zixiibacteriota bacterium]|nr:MAG: ABC transporter permease [candidate division Zixibacteria bacterium]
MNKVLTLGLKDLRLLWRDKGAVFWVLGFPLLMAIFFGAIFAGGGGSRGGIKLIVVDQDQSADSRLFVSVLSSSDALNVFTMPLDSAQGQVRRGKASAYLVIPPGYGNSFAFGPGEQASLELGIDPTRKAEIGLLQGLIVQGSFKRLQAQFANPPAMRDQLGRQIDAIDADTTGTEKTGTIRRLLTHLDRFYSEIETDTATDSQSATETDEAFMPTPKIEVVAMTDDRALPKSSYEITFPSSIMWALIGCAAAFAVSIVQERVRGTFLRLRIAPLTRAHILAGKGLACFFSCLAVCLFLMVFAHLVFGVRIDHPIKLSVAILSAIFCFVGLMMLISVSGRTEQAVGGIGWAVLLVFSMTGGGMIPLLFMPSWMQTVSHLSPVKWGIVAIEGAIWRGFSYSEMALPIFILLSIGISAFTIGVMVLARRDS